VQSGFVCFMNREDAEEAMEGCNETDPFNVGRLLMMRWGKNVKKSVRQGTGGGIAINPLQMGALERPRNDFYEEANFPSGSDGPPHVIELRGHNQAPSDISKAQPYEASVHSADAIRVEMPTDPNRYHFITTVASYVSKDGSNLERALIASEGGNPLFNFLTLKAASEQQRKEHLFYRWRVYSFCQGDSYSIWRAEPFVMFHPQGRYWIPPPLDKKAGIQETENKDERTEVLRQEKDKRRQHQGTREYLTGRQLERAKGGRRKGKCGAMNYDGGAKLTDEELYQFHLLVSRKLSISRETICSAMAFCFEKSGSAKEIAALLKQALTDDSPLVTVDMRIARLYLLSDILFNSQQPGVKNAFMYRDSLEKMAPEIFTSLGRHGGGSIGRMTMNKLRIAVSTVLGAWAEWSVYDHVFLDELQDRFEGKDIKDTRLIEQDQVTQEPEPKEEEKPPEPAEVIINTPQGGWTEVNEDADRDSEGENANDEQLDDVDGEPVEKNTCNSETTDYRVGKDGHTSGDTDGQTSQTLEVDRLEGTRNKEKGADASAHSNEVDTTGGMAFAEEEVDGVAMEIDDLDGTIEEEDVPVEEDEGDGTPLEDEGVDGAPLELSYIEGAPIEDREVDGAPIEDINVDGAPVEDDAIDGVPVFADGNVGAPIEEEGDIDGSPLEGDDIDGAPLEGDDTDGAPIDGNALDDEDLDGEAMEDGEDVDGEEIDGEEI
jgi:U2-associated protein SR140